MDLLGPRPFKVSMSNSDQSNRVVIMGAAGRDFHNFNMVYRDDPRTRVVAFTAASALLIARVRELN